MAALALPASASAVGRTTPEDRSDYLYVADHAVRPVGLLLETLVIRPFLGLTSVLVPDEVNHKPACRAFRPRRGCSRGR